MSPWLRAPATPVALGELAERLAAELSGDPRVLVRGVRAPAEAGPDDVAVVHHRRYLRGITVRAAALVVPKGLRLATPATLRVDHPRRALATLLELFHPPRPRAGVEPGARVDATATVPASAFVAAGAQVEAGVRLGERVEVHTGVVIGEGSTVGEGSMLFPHVVLYPGTRIGRRVRIHAGAVIGADGFGYERTPDGWLKVPQVGVVEIGDDVEIGANATIDRAVLEATRIGAGSKLDNLVQVGHNVELGARVLVAGLVGISGSARVGDDSILLGQVGVADHVTLAAGTVVGAQAGVHRDLASGEWFGAPAIPAAEARRAYPLIARLPELRRGLAELERRVSGLERALSGAGDPAGPPAEPAAEGTAHESAQPGQREESEE